MAHAARCVQCLQQQVKIGPSGSVGGRRAGYDQYLMPVETGEKTHVGHVAVPLRNPVDSRGDSIQSDIRSLTYYKRRC